MEAGRECFVVQEPGLARAEEFQTGSISTLGSPPALPPSSGYLEQIHGVGKHDPAEGEEQQVQEEGWWKQCTVRGVPSSLSRAPLSPKPPFINSFRGGSC